jgi:FtsP/CotA-like multicopper oxidase with cupredoxin domain
MNNKLRRSIQQIVLAGVTGAFATGAFAALGQQNPPPGPNQVPDYFGIVPNFANSPEPVLTQVSGGTGIGAAATTYDYTNWLPTQGVTDVQGGTGYTVGDNLTITDGGTASCNATVNYVDANGRIVPELNADGTIKTPAVTVTTAPCTGFITPLAHTGIHKFVDKLPGLSVKDDPRFPGVTIDGTNTLGQELPVAVPDTTTFPGSDYYEIAETEYTQQLHSDLPATHLRGYKQLNAPSANHPAAQNHYLGPIIVAQKGRAVRIKLVNQLSKGDAGKLPVPVDTTYMGADTTSATDNRTAVHLHGGNTPWISDGTPRQTVKPAGEVGPNRGESVRDVPDMWFDANGALIASCAGKLTCATGSNYPGEGSMTYYFTNQQSARLMFYHDHAEGITRLNVYAGMAAGYVLQDPTEQAMVNGETAQAAAAAMGYTGTELAKYDNTHVYPAVLPPLTDTIPLVIQEKTFVPNNTNPVMNFYGAFVSQLQSQDPTWRWGTTVRDATGNVISGFDAANNNIVSTGPNGNGDLWVPHVFMPNQNPGDITGGNAMGRWDYGPWFWPPFTAISNGPIDNPYYDPNCNTTTSYCEPATIPGVPNGSTAGVFNNMTNKQTSSPSGTPEAFNDTPLVNGTAYPYINVDPKQYRLRLLSVGNDRMLNLSLVVAASKNSKTTADDNAGATGVAKLCDGTDNTINPADCTEVKMVPFTSTQNSATPFPGHWYTQQKGGVTFDGRPSGVFDPRTRGPAMVQIGTEGGFLSSPVVIKNQPVNYEYNPKNILIGNIKEHALLLGPAERADVLVDFSQYAGSTLIMYNDAPAPVPAWDLRLDYFTGDYDNTDTGGAFSTIPGYGPNTRTVMQIRVSKNGGTVAANAAASRDSTGSINMATLTPEIQTAFRTSQEPIIVPQAAYNPVYGTNVPDSLGTDLSRIADYQLKFTPLQQDPLAATGFSVSTNPLDIVTMDMAPKTIIEDWTMNWGRMNALLGTEVPRTTSTIQTSIPQAYIDPPTELVKITPNTNATPISGTLADGTSLWKITHNGVDSHSIHFHLFHVQLVNRVGWDGAVYPPEANELGWKDSVLMHPLSDVIVALRPMTMELPFKVANSHRKLDPSQTAKGLDFFNLDPMTGNGSNVSDLNNADMNYGWEYVWHCHILGHEENDMMRAIAVAQPPEAPSDLTATTLSGNGGVKLNWKDNSMTANWVEISRSKDGVMKADGSAFQTIDQTFSVPVASLINPATNGVFGKKECDVQAGCLLSYTDKTAAATTSYYYRVVANNTVGGGAGRADKPLAPVAGGSWTYGETLPAGVNSLLPNIAGVNGYAGYANVTASSDAVTGSVILLPNAVLSASPVDFANQPINTTSVAKTVTLSNTGPGNMTITGIASSGAPFAISGGNCPTTFPATLNANSSCTINVTFAPTALGVANGTLTVTDNSGGNAGSTQTVSLTGTGIASLATLTPNLVTFADTNVGSTSATQTVTLKNISTASLVYTRIAAAAVTGPFTRTGGTCRTGTGTTTLNAGASCTIILAFKPTVAGLANGSLTVTAGGTQIAASLSGTGLSSTVKANNDTVTANVDGNRIQTVTVNVRANDVPANTGTVSVVSLTKTATAGATATVDASNRIVLRMTGTGNGGTAYRASKRGVYTVTYSLNVGGVISQATATITMQ